jgi:hypothetical protein
LRTGRAEAKRARDSLDKLVLLSAKVLRYHLTNRQLHFLRWKVFGLTQRVGLNVASISHNHLLIRQRVERTTDNITLPFGGPHGGEAAWRLTAAEVKCLDEFGVDLEDGYNRNLERLMELLFSQRFVLQRSKNAGHWPQLDLVNSIIKKAQTFLWTRVTVGPFAGGEHSVRDLYERFYRKLVLRDRALPRPWVFTTNYDVFSETAMDRLGIPYANGFTGVVERRFNPSSGREGFGRDEISEAIWNPRTITDCSYGWPSVAIC